MYVKEVCNLVRKNCTNLDFGDDFLCHFSCKTRSKPSTQTSLVDVFCISIRDCCQLRMTCWEFGGCPIVFSPTVSTPVAKRQCRNGFHQVPPSVLSFRCEGCLTQRPLLWVVCVEIGWQIIWSVLQFCTLTESHHVCRCSGEESWFLLSAAACW